MAAGAAKVGFPFEAIRTPASVHALTPVTGRRPKTLNAATVPKMGITVAKSIITFFTQPLPSRVIGVGLVKVRNGSTAVHPVSCGNRQLFTWAYLPVGADPKQIAGS
jgi:hypothetical protein